MKNSFLFCLIALALCITAAPAGASGDSSETDVEIEHDYREKLLSLAETDQAIRRDALARFTAQQLQNDKAAARELAVSIARAQAANQKQLQKLMVEFGFPDQRAVGADGAHAAFLVAQHSTDREFRAGFLAEIERSLKDKAFALVDYAMFIDRNRFFEGEPQIYGTQRDAHGQLFSVEDPQNLSARRASVGLPDDNGMD